MFKIRKIHCTRLASINHFTLFIRSAILSVISRLRLHLLKKAQKKHQKFTLMKKRNKEPQSDNPFHYRL